MAIPLHRLPSLDLLRGFVAVGRRMSITLAAQDLYLTQSAVSRQVQALEEVLGCKLLTRGHRAIHFTPEGERLFRIANGALQQLQDAVAALTAKSERQPVTITANIGFTGLWLLPRLGQFQQRYPGIDVRVAANNTILDLRAEGIDLAIRYCREAAAPPGAQRLFGDVVVPVAHPSLNVGRLDAKVLSEQILLEYDDPGRPRRPWLQWSDRLSSAGLVDIKPRGVLRFNQYDQVIQAAATGQGIALGRRELVQTMLADGRLVVLDWGEADASSSYAFWLVQAEPTPRDDVRIVLDWLLSHAQLP
jgi:LysR family glycine cleavage system transcriptional activator